jgi:hypothetical protein
MTESNRGAQFVSMWHSGKHLDSSLGQALLYKKMELKSVFKQTKKLFVVPKCIDPDNDQRWCSVQVPEELDEATIHHDR